MESAELLSRLAEWLLAQNSLAARLLADRPQLLGLRLTGIKPGRLTPPPSLRPDEDEELAVGRLRAWRAEGLLSLALALITGRLGPAAVAARLERSAADLIEAGLTLADMTLRQRYHHPLSLPGEDGPGPILILGSPVPSRGEAGFETPHSLLFLFARGQSAARPLDEADFERTLHEPKQFIIPKDYVLKLAQRIIAYLTLDNPKGPGISLAPPEGLEPGGDPIAPQVGPQISALDRFIDFFAHQASDAGLFGLTRLTPMAGQRRLNRRFRRLVKELVLAEPWTTDRLAETVAALRGVEAEEFDPLDAPGCLSDLGLALDALLLSAGLLPSGDNRTRLKAAAAADVLDGTEAEKLERALASLTRAHLLLSLLGRDMPGHNLISLADLEAALALTPSRGGPETMPLGQAREVVSGALARFG